MGRRKTATDTPLPKALVCGLLEDEGRILFLVRKEHNVERIELPCTVVPSGRSEFAEIKEKFREQTGIDGEIQEVVYNTRFNAGSRKRKNWIPCLVFKITARKRRAVPSKDFSGFRWLSLKDTKKEKLSRKTEWLRRFIRELKEEGQRKAV